MAKKLRVSEQIIYSWRKRFRAAGSMMERMETMLETDMDKVTTDKVEVGIFVTTPKAFGTSPDRLRRY